MPNTYYPILKNENTFMQLINYMYFPLKKVKPEIIHIFKQEQLFTSENNPFLYNLNSLTNENKHKNLTKQTKRKRGYIENFEYEGIKIQNSTFENVGELLVINDIPIDPAVPNRFTNNFSGEIETYFIFDDLGKPVSETLSEIYLGVRSIIYDLKVILERD